MKMLDQKEVELTAHLSETITWIEGWINVPDGKLIIGYTGKETVVNRKKPKMLHTFFVSDATDKLSEK